MAGAIKGRGALSHPPGRFDKLTQTLEHDGWYEEEPPNKLETVVLPEPARSIISRNKSPDIGFESVDQSISGMRSWMYLLLRPPEPRLPRPFPRPRLRNQTFLQSRRRSTARNRARCPQLQMRRPSCSARTPTPTSRSRKRTRSRARCSRFCSSYKHPVTITTKGALVARDVDLLAELARDGLTRVMFSIPTLNDDMKRVLEPRAAAARPRGSRPCACWRMPACRSGCWLRPSFRYSPSTRSKRCSKPAARPARRWPDTHVTIALGGEGSVQGVAR